MSLLDRNRLIGLLPQRTTLNMPFDVHYVILTGRFPYTDGYNYSKNDFEVTDEVISKFDIEHLRKRQFNELSGGEKQRVLLARILNRDTPVMLLDEPLTGIDLRHQLETIELLKNLRQEKLIMVVMHDISLAIREFDRFLFFTEGRLIYNQEADEINESNLSEIFQVQVKFIRDQEKLFIHTEL